MVVTLSSSSNDNAGRKRLQYRLDVISTLFEGQVFLAKRRRAGFNAAPVLPVEQSSVKRTGEGLVRSAIVRRDGKDFAATVRRQPEFDWRGDATSQVNSDPTGNKQQHQSHQSERR